MLFYVLVSRRRRIRALEAMMFMNPLPVVCEQCGAAQAHPPSRLLAFEVRCVDCGITLRDAGRRMHHGISQANAIHMQLVLAIELEDAFGVSLNDHHMHENDTLDTFLAAMISQRPELADRLTEFRAYGVRFLKESVHSSKAHRVEQDSFYELYASELDSTAQSRAS